MRPQLPRLAAITLGLCALTTVGLAPVAVARPGHGPGAARHHVPTNRPVPTTGRVPRAVPSTGGPVTSNPSYTVNGGYAVAVDSKRGLVYMPDPGTSLMTVYDERTRTATKVPMAPDSNADTIGLDQGTGYVYMPGGRTSNQITVLRAGVLVGTVSLPAPDMTYDVAVDQVRHLAYVAGQSKVYVLRGAHLMATVPVGDGGYTPVVNPTNGLVYVPTYNDGNVSVIKGTRVVATVDIGDDAVQAAVDPLSGLVYVTTYGDTVSVLHGTRSEPVATLHTGSQTYAVAVNPQTHLVYVADDDENTVTVIRGTRVLRTLHVPVAYDGSVAVNPVTGLVLVAGTRVGGVNDVGAVTAIRGAKVLSTTPIGENTFQPAFDTRTGRAFVTAHNSLLDLQTPTLATVTVRRPQRSRVYHQGVRVLARYSCAAGVNDVLRSCVARVRNGRRIDTRLLGRHAFTVTARSAYGTTVRTTVHYRVRR